MSEEKKLCPGMIAKQAIKLIEKTVLDTEVCIIDCDLKDEEAYLESAKTLSHILGVIHLANVLLAEK
jgi:hypothetical protein